MKTRGKLERVARKLFAARGFAVVDTLMQEVHAKLKGSASGASDPLQWHGSHTTDIPMRDIVDVMLAVQCQAYSFEAGNVRHEHEWRVWQEVKLPDEKLVLPGVVSHATNVVEHPELVAERILRIASVVGRERVIAATDCGLGGRVHPQIAWAKLETLAQGGAGEPAALAPASAW